MTEEVLIRPWMSHPAGHMLRRWSTAGVLVVDAVCNCKVFQAKIFFAADNLIAEKNFFPFCTNTDLTEWVSKANKWYVSCPSLKKWIIQFIQVLRSTQTFPSYMQFFATFSALCVTRCSPTVVTLGLFSTWLFAISLALKVSAVLLWLGCFFGSTDLLLISTNLPHKPTSVSGGFIVLCCFSHNKKLRNVTILGTMTISFLSPRPAIKRSRHS